MRVLLVAANTERTAMPAPPLGAALVAAATRAAGHEVAFLDLLRAADPPAAVAAALRDVRPEVIGVSVRNVDDQQRVGTRFLLDQVRTVLATCRAASTAPIVLGGAGYTMFPRAALEHLGADLGVAGEGEAAFPALLEVLAAGGDPASVPGVVVRGRSAALPPCRIADLDPLPPPDPVEAGAGPDAWVPIQTRRGCPLRCSYCSTPSIEGRRLRRRSVPRVLEEIRGAMAAGARRLHFVDNTFNLPPSYALALCRELERFDPRPTWRCIVYPRGVTRELARAMAAAGCVEASLGFESGAEPVLRSLGKGFRPEHVRSAAQVLAEAGIRVFGFLMLGAPGETRATVKESLAFVRGLPLADLRMTVGVRIYPGTPLAEQARREGVVDPDDDLLQPRFYLAPGLDDWIDEEIARWTAAAPPA